MEVFLSVETPSGALFLVFKRCSRRLGRAAPFTAMALVLDAVVGVVVVFWPGSDFGTLDGDAEGARPPFRLVCTSGGGGFFILVAVPAGLATTAAIARSRSGSSVLLPRRI